MFEQICQQLNLFLPYESLVWPDGMLIGNSLQIVSRATITFLVSLIKGNNRAKVCNSTVEQTVWKLLLASISTRSKYHFFYVWPFAFGLFISIPVLFKLNIVFKTSVKWNEIRMEGDKFSRVEVSFQMFFKPSENIFWHFFRVYERRCPYPVTKDKIRLWDGETDNKDVVSVSASHAITTCRYRMIIKRQQIQVL